MFKKIQNIHFIGIGGSGMSGIAEVLLTLKYKVSGSDLKKSDVTQRLVRLGAKVSIGHKPTNIKNAHVVVTSTAVTSENPELQAAIQRKIPIIPRIEMLAELARLKYTIGIAGTHGKTTTTSFASLVLQEGGLDPTVVVGGRLHNIGTGARVGKGDYMVAEADESDGSFLKLSPTIAVITNIDSDHLDHWGNMKTLLKAFEQYSGKVPFYGKVILGIDNANVRRIVPQIQRPKITYGLSPEAEVRADHIQTTSKGLGFDVYQNSQKLGRVEWSVSGRHNVMNALAAVAVGLELNVPFPKIAKALCSFKGVARRLELKGEKKGMIVLDDYGHHPTEIQATLKALKERYPERRLVVLFQPHRYSRTQLLEDKFSKSFSSADHVFLLEIYPAGEKPISGVNSARLGKKLNNNGVDVRVVSKAQSLKALRNFVQPGDVVLTLGAGDVWKWGEALLGKKHKGVNS